ncbi:hypothetical protein N7537_006226 [Penicillium hordei]|uniref:Xylanolytic transcriptional activator regulatory domain-containing protein n=1 Tax=Penicillium hordei TaxID=40994 RepID=A0AAD6E737_9EURO|nr:uncharacterized protein N7537_006226 [Penicillium hordei]KAJ5603270.1 hypothetical protein N7537_006226 [Penicillium hordei]
MGTPKLVNPTARAQSEEPDESNVLVRDIEVTVPIEPRPPICDGEIPLAHTESFSFSDLVGAEFNGSVLSEDLGFDFCNNDFDNLMGISENDVLMLCDSDDDDGDTSPRRTMDFASYLEDTGSRTQPSYLALVGGTDTFTRYQPITQGAQGPLQACWPTELAAQRYVRAFFGSFQRHIPLLHLPTYLAHQRSKPLQFAIYAVGALYVFNGAEARQLYRAGHEAFLAQKSLLAPLERLQTLLLLTMFGSWSDDDDLRAEAIPLQSQLAEEEDWKYLFSSAPRPQTFKVALHNLTSLCGPVLQIDSGLGNLVLMIALYTHVRSCKSVSSSLPTPLGREITETSTVSLRRWLNSLAGSGIGRQHEQIGADCSLTASALILWKVATIQLYADFDSVVEVQDAILALSTGQQQTISALQPIRMPTHTAEAMGHAVSFVHGPVLRGIQFLKATACADISIYAGLMGFHCVVLLVRWLSSLESASKATGSQCTHPDELLLLQNIREFIGESDQPSIEGVPLSVACARIWVEILESDRQIWGVRKLLRTYLDKLI